MRRHDDTIAGLERLAASSTFEGERAAARRAIEVLKRRSARMEIELSVAGDGKESWPYQLFLALCERHGVRGEGTATRFGVSASDEGRRVAKAHLDLRPMLEGKSAAYRAGFIEAVRLGREVEERAEGSIAAVRYFQKRGSR